MRRWATAGATVALGATLAGVACPPATADDTAPGAPDAPDDGLQHNVTYRARVDGLARGALISYRISDTSVNTADPSMLPGRTFEATAVLSEASDAGMRISIQWPYSANLVCEILVDDQTVAAASQFIAPRLTPARDDPDYGALNCGAPLTDAPGIPLPLGDPAAPVDPAAPAGPVGAPPPAVDPVSQPVS